MYALLKTKQQHAKCKGPPGSPLAQDHHHQLPTWPLAPMRSEHLLVDILNELVDIEPATHMTCAKAEDQVAASVAPMWCGRMSLRIEGHSR